MNIIKNGNPAASGKNVINYLGSEKQKEECLSYINSLEDININILRILIHSAVELTIKYRKI